jgi:hypothetical protein
VNTARAPAAASTAAAGNPADFDLAISYVTKIKNRFNTERHTYKTFLELLNGYQSGQLRMLALLEQVCKNHYQSISLCGFDRSVMRLLTRRVSLTLCLSVHLLHFAIRYLCCSQTTLTS